MNNFHKQDIYYTNKLKEFIKYSQSHINDENYYKYLGHKTHQEFLSEGISNDIGLKRCLKAIKQANHFIYLKGTQYYEPGTNIPVPGVISYAFIIPINSGNTHKYMMFIANKNVHNNTKYFISWHKNDEPLSSKKYHWVMKKEVLK